MNPKCRNRVMTVSSILATFSFLVLVFLEVFGLEQYMRMPVIVFLITFPIAAVTNIAYEMENQNQGGPTCH